MEHRIEQNLDKLWLQVSEMGMETAQHIIQQFPCRFFEMFMDPEEDPKVLKKKGIQSARAPISSTCSEVATTSAAINDSTTPPAILETNNHEDVVCSQSTLGKSKEDIVRSTSNTNGFQASTTTRIQRTCWNIGFHHKAEEAEFIHEEERMLSIMPKVQKKKKKRGGIQNIEAPTSCTCSEVATSARNDLAMPQAMLEKSNHEEVVCSQSTLGKSKEDTIMGSTSNIGGDQALPTTRIQLSSSNIVSHHEEECMLSSKETKQLHVAALEYKTKVCHSTTSTSSKPLVDHDETLNSSGANSLHIRKHCEEGEIGSIEINSPSTCDHIMVSGGEDEGKFKILAPKYDDNLVDTEMTRHHTQPHQLLDNQANYSTWDQAHLRKNISMGTNNAQEENMWCVEEPEHKSNWLVEDDFVVIDSV